MSEKTSNIIAWSIVILIIILTFYGITQINKKGLAKYYGGQNEQSNY